jgi:hypothetical protein
MSYIDTFDHELVGFFAGLPLYRPLEIVAGSGGDEFGCTPLQLVLGGGSGEHPAVVLAQPRAAVVWYLQATLPADRPALSQEPQRLLDEVPPRRGVPAIPRLGDRRLGDRRLRVVPRSLSLIELRRPLSRRG